MFARRQTQVPEARQHATAAEKLNREDGETRREIMSVVSAAREEVYTALSWIFNQFNGHRLLFEFTLNSDRDIEASVSVSVKVVSYRNGWLRNMNDIHQIKNGFNMAPSISLDLHQLISHVNAKFDARVLTCTIALGARIDTQPSRVTDTSQYFRNCCQVKNPHRRHHLQQTLQNLGQNWPVCTSRRPLCLSLIHP